MAPPPLIFCDTDCLIQIFICQQTGLLKWFKARYGFQAVIVPEVEAELSWHAKFRGRFDPALQKGLDTGITSVFDYSRPDLQLANFFPNLQAATAAALSIGKMGHDYSLRIGPGEAYSHAACIHVAMPLLSHDKSAIDTLLFNNLISAVPVLRVFDLLLLAFKQGGMDAKACDAARKALDRTNEWLPRAFARTSFQAGVSQFDRRLYDRSECAGTPPPCRRFNDPLYLTPTT